MLNAHINAPQLKDRDFVQRALLELDALVAECGPLSERVHAAVRAKLA